MGAGPLIGVFYHWLGGVASASFYVPYKRIRLWSWEVFWITGGIFSWLIMPWVMAFTQTDGVVAILGMVSAETLFWCWFWGAAWGFGGLTFGLTMRYLGLSLGMAMALGLTTVIGTLGPPIFDGVMLDIAATRAGQMTLLGILVTVGGLLCVARAGSRKEQELADKPSAGDETTDEFNLRKGLMIAVFSGVMSSCFAFGLAAGQPLRDAALAAGVDPLWQGLPVLCVVLTGGLTTNALWCAYLIRRNGTAGEFIGRGKPGVTLPLLRNYMLAAAGGTLWYFQFFFYTMGESRMGEFGFSSWTIHMASIILFSTLWGFLLKEWKGVSTGTRTLVWAGISLLVGATVIIGLGNMMA